MTPCARFAFLAALPVACAAPSPPPPTAPAPPSAVAPDAGPPSYRSVHIDTIAPGKFPQFEAARREWVDVLRRANATDGRGLFVEVDGDHFYTLRPFAQFGGTAERARMIEESMKRVPKEAGDRYDRLCDTALVFPHTSEVWQIDDDLTYTPAVAAPTEATAACGTLVLDDVRPDPDSEERFSSATQAINKALAQAKYPLSRLAFRTVYGAGHFQTMVLAPSKEALDAAPSVETAVAGVLGAARARELLAQTGASVEKHATHPIVLRHDLTWP
jgi:hypothetical protein